RSDVGRGPGRAGQECRERARFRGNVVGQGRGHRRGHRGRGVRSEPGTPKEPDTMNTHEWIEEQRTLIDNGIAAATIRLEGVDETAWGTWPIALEGLADRIDATIATLADDLPKGRHNLRLLALDAKQLQIACRPLTITGKSAAA